MSALLPARLPAGFTLAPATGADVAEAFELRAAEQTAAFGFCPSTPEDVRSMLELPDATVNVQYLVRAADGIPVQWWAALRDRGDPIHTRGSAPTRSCRAPSPTSSHGSAGR